MTDRCPLCGGESFMLQDGTSYECSNCPLNCDLWPAVQALKDDCENWRDAASFEGVQQMKDRIAELETDNLRLNAELDRLDSWDGLMSLLDKRWPEDIFPTLPDDVSRDAGPRIVSLLRWVDKLKAELAAVVKLLQAVDEQAGNGAPDWQRHCMTPGLRNSIRDHLNALTPDRKETE